MPVELISAFYLDEKSSDWLIDSGATKHMCHDKSAFDPGTLNLVLQNGSLELKWAMVLWQTSWELEQWPLLHALTRDCRHLSFRMHIFRSSSKEKLTFYILLEKWLQNIVQPWNCSNNSIQRALCSYWYVPWWSVFNNATSWSGSWSKHCWWFGKDIELDNLRTFGSVCYGHVSSQIKSKAEWISNDVQCIFHGNFSDDGKYYKLLNL